MTQLVVVVLSRSDIRERKISQRQNFGTVLRHVGTFISMVKIIVIFQKNDFAVTLTILTMSCHLQTESDTL